MKERIRRWLIQLACWILSFGQESLYRYARRIVENIEYDERFRAVVEREKNIAFCPRCGQRPSSDYRHEEAFQLITEKFPNARRSDINFCIELAHWRI